MPEFNKVHIYFDDRFISHVEIDGCEIFSQDGLEVTWEGRGSLPVVQLSILQDGADISSEALISPKQPGLLERFARWIRSRRWQRGPVAA